MIPKVIHYCWFGRNPKPKSVIKCINSWKKFFPDYEIKEWNEDNFDIEIIPYTRDAYQAKKYAFVSDYARIWILYHYGGIYFDTDVEVIRPMEQLITKGGFMGCEIDYGVNYAVAPGLGLGTDSQHPIYQEILAVYEQLPFYIQDHKINPQAIVRITTDVLLKNGLQQIPSIQNIKGINIYPTEYFNPYDYVDGRLKITNNTYSIHWFDQSWIGQKKWRIKLAQWYHRLINRKLQ